MLKKVDVFECWFRDPLEDTLESEAGGEEK